MPEYIAEYAIVGTYDAELSILYLRCIMSNCAIVMLILKFFQFSI